MELAPLPNTASTSLMVGSSIAEVSRLTSSAPIGSAPIVIGIGVLLESLPISSVVTKTSGAWGISSVIRKLAGRSARGSGSGRVRARTRPGC